MRTNIGYIASRVLPFLFILSACNSEEEWSIPQPSGYLQIEGEIVGAGMATTKAKTEDILDMSFTRFGDNDSIGFYAFHEETCTLTDRWLHQLNNCKDDDKDYIKNEKLVYSGSKFISDSIRNVALNKLGMTFAYFPYAGTEKKPQDYPLNPSKIEQHHYIHIFNEKGQVVDFLTATKMQYTDINYEFHHEFSMLLLFLGEGFDATMPENEVLKVHLTKHVLGAHLVRKWKSGFPYEVFEVSVDTIPLGDAGKYSYGSSSFMASKKEDYVLPDSEGAPRTVYPVILPAGVKIDYIEVTDKTGTLQKVKPTNEALPKLEKGFKYPLTIRMDGLAPTVYPHKIIDWNDKGTITVKEPYGIYTREQLKTWLDLYNKHAEDDFADTGDEFETLQKYGNYDENRNHWTFYLRDNIDCEGIEATGGVLMNVLRKNVTLDGGNHILKNLTLDLGASASETGKIGMIGTIEEGGYLQNLHLEYVTVKNTIPADIPVGCIAAEINGGQIIGCTVKQAVMSCKDTSKAGVLAGRMSGGTVDVCKFHGMVQVAGALDDEKLRGVVGVVENESNVHVMDIINRVILTD